MIEQVVRAVDIKDNIALVEPIRKESAVKSALALVAEPVLAI